jgi:pseudaminic acid cytidylyltransferase
MNVAVIPARGGSKRILKKNIKEFCGKSIIAWPIEAARRSGLFQKILVSTDDEEIAEISRSFGAEIPFMRPTELSDDYCSTGEVMAHAVSWMNDHKWKIEDVCCIYGTAVFFNVEDIKFGYSTFSTGNWSYVFSATDFEYPIFRSFREHPDGGVEMIFKENFEKRSQDLPIALHDATQFYWGKSHTWLKNLKMFDRHSHPIKIPRWRVQDIDTEDDWKRAEIMFDMLRKKNIKQ